MTDNAVVPQNELQNRIASDIMSGKMSIKDLKIWFRDNKHLLSPEKQQEFAARVKALEKTKVEWRPYPNRDDQTQPSPQELAYETPAFELLYGGTVYSGKLSPLESRVVTPMGWKFLGDVGVGDYLVDPTTGGSEIVLATFPQGKQPIYQVTFDDGACLEVGLEHLWAYRPITDHDPRTKASSQRQYALDNLGASVPDERWNYLRVGQTKELIEYLKKGTGIRIPLTEPVLFTMNGRTGTGEVPPYLLGLLLGDGHLPNCSITACDDEIRDYLLGLEFRGGTDLHTDGKPKDYVATGRLRALLKAWQTNNSIEGARAWEKFIPRYVFTAPIDYRLELLRGLMDSDGYSAPNGHCYYCSTSLQLAQDVRELVWGLGGKVLWRARNTQYSSHGEKKTGRTSYDIEIQIKKTSALFKLSRKRERCTDTHKMGELMRSIKSIDYVGEKDSMCILVNTPYGLYLGDDYVVTHNSQLILGLAGTRHKRSLLLRRKFPDLERSLIEDSFKIYGDPRRYNKTKHVWRLGSRRVEFGHVNNEGTPQNPGDESAYASAQYDLIAFDQLEQFSPNTYEFLISRARTASDPTQRVRVVSSCNFVGQNVQWLRERWAAWLDNKHPNPAKSGEIRYYKKVEGKEVETTADDPDGLSRTFIMAKMRDNPYPVGDQYRKQINSMPEPYRSALLEGDINAMLSDDPDQIIPTSWVEEAMKRWTPEHPDVAMSAMGMDIAHGGDDSSCYAPRYEDWYGKVVNYPGVQTPDGPTAARYATEVVESKATPINGDVIGWGASACEHLEQVLGYSVNKVNFGSSSGARDRSGKWKFLNKRVQYYTEFSYLLDPQSERKISLPPDPILKADLCSVRRMYSGDTVKCEDKLDIKKRIGRSPDEGDAVVLASIEASMPGFRTLG